MSVAELIAVLLLHLAGVHVEAIRASGRTVRVQARARETSAACPACGGRSERVHSRSERAVCDAGVSSRQTVLHLWGSPVLLRCCRLREEDVRRTDPPI
jgi:hypothetical protein